MSVSWLNSGIAAFKEWLARSDAASPRERLRAEIEAEIDENPWPAEGAVWAARPQEWWADKLGVCKRQVRRIVTDLVEAKQVKTVQKRVAGERMVLYREGDPDEKSPEDYARALVKIWRKRVKQETHREFGMFTELGRRWGKDGPAILTNVLDDWSGFMAGVQLEIAKLIAAGEKAKHGYFKAPKIALILRFETVAREFYVIKLGKATPSTPT